MLPNIKCSGLYISLSSNLISSLFVPGDKTNLVSFSSHLLMFKHFRSCSFRYWCYRLACQWAPEVKLWLPFRSQIWILNPMSDTTLLNITFQWDGNSIIYIIAKNIFTSNCDSDGLGYQYIPLFIQQLSSGWSHNRPTLSYWASSSCIRWDDTNIVIISMILSVNNESMGHLQL